MAGFARNKLDIQCFTAYSCTLYTHMELHGYTVLHATRRWLFLGTGRFWALALSSATGWVAWRAIVL